MNEKRHFQICSNKHETPLVYLFRLPTLIENGLYVGHNLTSLIMSHLVVAQWLSDRVLDLRPNGRGFEPHRRHCVVVLEQDTFILA